MASRRRALLTLIAYARVTQCSYIWDDNFHVTANPTLRDLHGLRRIWIVRALHRYTIHDSQTAFAFSCS